MNSMRAITTCFSILQVPRCRLYTLANFWQEGFLSLPRKCGNLSSFRLLSSKSEGSYSRRYIGRKDANKCARDSSKSASFTHEILDEAVSTSATLNVRKADINEFQRLEYSDIQPQIFENKDTANVTVIVFDIETTGFSRENERIIEIALQDLRGGKNSTFQTLINPGPGHSVPNSHVHGITTHMVNRPGVPSMEELIPILLQYIKSRQKKGGYVLLAAHNSRTFDVPFLINEFKRHGYDIPPDWLFIDTLPIAREWMKSSGEAPSKTSLEALCQRFKIEFTGKAHRAMADVNALAFVLQKLSFDLKLSLSNLVAMSFTASDVSGVQKKKKKKNSS